MLRGLANLNLVADDMTAAIDWYTRVLDAPPYFTRPETGPAQYAEWRFGDDEDELALMSSAYRPALPSPGGALVSIHVDDIPAAFDRLVELGAKPFDPVTQRGEGWWSASVSDPFGNLLGLIQSPHWAAQHA
ncbi:VOC family protein [Microbacterium immunditiarum]|uniref:Putative enzyme related to lactoylglutathione lyase n=1 Tax=Microbacterium immunditiarum TaxID=337480 RepID=A0A7Y9GMM4_9MICO|nr:VOC family protein [Microbacterium immunditiarum]NYE19290.1 putative enzyme related to lactoylglutathione lyase [Microbacterium immunditiarum]